MNRTLERILPKVQKPARYTGGEYNAVVKDRAQVDTRYALCFPDTYEIGMSNLGMRILYGAMNQVEGLWCERAFAPWGDMEEEMRREGIQLYGLESGDPLCDFDIIGFSLGYEMAYTNVLNMLDLAGLPLRSEERRDLAPLVVAGEESPDEPAIRERGMELLFSKRDLKDAAARQAFGRLSAMQSALTEMGRALLDTALTLDTATARQWFDEALPLFSGKLPSRVVNNLACCMAGLRLTEAMCSRLGFSWGQVFPVGMDACAKHLAYAAREYLLDGGESNKSVVEQTLEVMDRMGLNEDECRRLDGDVIALHVKGFYDRYTQYRREHAIMGECLPYAQFMKQLRKSDLYLETRNVRIGEEQRKAVLLNYALLRQRCDVDGFLKSQVEPLGLLPKS